MPPSTRPKNKISNKKENSKKELFVSAFVVVCAMVAASLSLGTYIGYLSVVFSQQQLSAIGDIKAVNLIKDVIPTRAK